MNFTLPYLWERGRIRCIKALAIHVIHTFCPYKPLFEILCDDKTVCVWCSVCQNESSFNNHILHTPYSARNALRICLKSIHNFDIGTPGTAFHSVAFVCAFCIRAYTYKRIYTYIQCDYNNVAHLNETPNDPSILAYWQTRNEWSCHEVLTHYMCTIFLRGYVKGMRAFIWEYRLLSQLTEQ